METKEEQIEKQIKTLWYETHQAEDNIESCYALINELQDQLKELKAKKITRIRVGDVYKTSINSQLPLIQTHDLNFKLGGLGSLGSLHSDDERTEKEMIDYLNNAKAEKIGYIKFEAIEK